MQGWTIVVGAAVLAASQTVLLAQTPAAPTATAAGATLVSAGQEPRQRLTYRFTPGEFAHYEVVNKMTMVVRYQQLEDKVSNESHAWKQYRVISVDEQGHAWLELLVERVSMSAQFGGEPIVYDSTQPGEPPHQFRDIAKTVGKPFARIQAAPSGKLVKVTLLDGAPTSLSAGDPTDPHLNFLTTLPEEPVGVGAVWKDRYNVPVTVGKGLTSNVVLQRQYELTKIDGNVATISLKTSLITPNHNPEIAVQLMQRKPVGVLEFDIEKGAMLSQRTAASDQVVGPFGPQSQAQGSMETVERRLPGPATTAGVQPARLEAAAAQ